MNKHLEIATVTNRQSVVSLVVPVCNEFEVLPEFIQRSFAALAGVDCQFEIIFVDDGSTDGSCEYLSEQIKSKPRLKLLKLSRNFGKEAALTAGIEHALGDALIILDADLQDPPELIPDMLKAWQKGADVVLMRRRKRLGETWLKRSSAYIYYRLLNMLSQSEIPADTGDFRLMSRRATDALLMLSERNRYMKGLFAWVGMPTVVIDFDRPERQAGNTSWDYLGLMKLALDGISSFSISPLRYATLLGMFAATLGGCFGIWIVLKALVFGSTVAGYPSLVALMTFLGGIQLLGIGIVGEYVGKTYIETKRRPIYLIEEIRTSKSHSLNTHHLQVIKKHA